MNLHASTIILSVRLQGLHYLYKIVMECVHESFCVVDIDGFYKDISFVYKNVLSGNASKYYIFFDRYWRDKASDARFFYFIAISLS